MTIDWTHFTPWASLAGGALIGVAAAMLVLLNGRIAGISGIVGGLLAAAARRHRLARWPSWPGCWPRPPRWFSWVGALAPRIDAGLGMLLVAGLLVGLGTRYGAGCTSGHGVCGLSRLSPRSLVATGAFMAAGIATVFVTRHLI